MSTDEKKNIFIANNTVISCVTDAETIEDLSAHYRWLKVCFMLFIRVRTIPVSSIGYRSIPAVSSSMHTSSLAVLALDTGLLP